MNNFYKKPTNPIVETMNNNYINYQSDLDRLKSQNFSNKTTKNNNNNFQNDEQKENPQNLNNNLMNLLKNQNLTALLPLISGNSNITDILNKPESKNELIMNLISQMNQNNIQTKTQYKDIDISSLPKIDDYNIL